MAKKNNLNIVYKSHPKESTATIKREIKILTKKFNFNDRFLFSEKNTYHLAKHSSFNISFYSSVCLDMIKLGLTPVEYIEKNKIKSSDFAKYNLTLFCNNEKGLNEIFNKIKKIHIK